jgi:hypothetical protein
LRVRSCRRTYMHRNGVYAAGRGRRTTTSALRS